MPSGPRVTTNNAFGTTLNNPLAAGGTTLNSVELAILSEVTAAHAIITLDPLRQNGEPELVIVTAHAPGAQTATIVRGAYNTIARSHPVGTVWLHGPVTEDVIKIATSTTRPADPYAGQVIYENDLGKYSSYTGAAWVGLLPVGMITPYGADTAPLGWFLCDGAEKSRTVYADLFATVGVTFGTGNGTTTFNVPNLLNSVPVGKGSNFPTLGAVGGSKDAVAVSHNHTQNSHNHTQDSHNHTQNQHGHSADDNQIGDHTHHSPGNNFVFERGQVESQRIPDAGSTSNGVYVTYSPNTQGGGSHNHDITVNGFTATNQGFTATNQGQTATNQSSGVSGTDANMPPYLVVRYIIKY